MRLALWIASLWPGLAQAWLLGTSRGLGLAIAFAAALNVALIATFVWPRWPIASGPAGLTAVVAWVSVLGLWVIGMRSVRRDWSKLAPPARTRDSQQDEWFCQAQHEYLQGHWIEAETLLVKLLSRQPADAEARLLLASVQRRTREWDQARQTLTELKQLESATKWHWEINAELSQLTALQSEVTDEATPTAESLGKAA